jgi:hypothetical protein
MEVGAARGHAKPLKFILAPGVTVSALQRPLSSFHMARWDDTDSWLQLAEEVVEETGCRRRNVSRWRSLASAISTAHLSDAQQDESDEEPAIRR